MEMSSFPELPEFDIDELIYDNCIQIRQSNFVTQYIDEIINEEYNQVYEKKQLNLNQIRALEELLNKNKNPCKEERQAFANLHDMREHQVYKWLWEENRQQIKLQTFVEKLDRAKVDITYRESGGFKSSLRVFDKDKNEYLLRRMNKRQRIDVKEFFGPSV